MKASIHIYPQRKIGDIHPHIYGQFLCRRKWVADLALYNPEHPDAEKDTGLRKKVVKAITEAAPPIIRWPGGCTGTSYDWRDGIGPREERQNTIDAHFGYDVGNGFGTAEFIQFCRRIGAEPQINLSTGFGTLREGIEWIEYCNYPGGSRFSDLRKKHGYEKPFNVKYWQIGNENYGGYEIGAHSPEQFADIAFEWGKTIKKFDKSLKVIVVGGSAHHRLDWDYTVLRRAWQHIDYITAHRYWHYNSEEGVDNYDPIAAIGYAEEIKIKALAGLIELAAWERGSHKRPKIAFTEWNVQDRGFRDMSNEWKPKNTKYRLVDALGVAGFINAMQKQCNVVTLANFAQSINVAGMLFVTDDQVVKETVFWPMYLQRHFSGPEAIQNYTECDSYSSEFDAYAECHKKQILDAVPYLDVSTTYDEKKKKIFISIVNRHKKEKITTRIKIDEMKPKTEARMHLLYHDDPFQKNTLKKPDEVKPKESKLKIKGTEFEIGLLPHSYTILELSI